MQNKQQKENDIANIMWVEKYRPKNLDQIINQKEIIIGLKNF